MSILPQREDDPFSQPMAQPAGPWIGPQARPLARRSQYLLQALEQMREGSQQINSYGELGTRLLANALLQYGQRRNERALSEAQGRDAANELARMEAVAAALSGGGTPRPTQPDNPPAGLSQPPAASQPSPQGQPPTVADALAGSGSQWGAADAPAYPNMTDSGRDMLARLLIGEDRDPQGQRAAASVVFNRARAADMPLEDVIAARSQFEPYGNRQTWQRLQQINPNSPEYQQALAAIEQAQREDVTNGATHFWSPEAQAAQIARGSIRPAVPDWVQRAQAGGQQGQRIGGNVYYNLPYGRPPGYAPSQPSPFSPGAGPMPGMTPRAPVPSDGGAPAGPGEIMQAGGPPAPPPMPPMGGPMPPPGMPQPPQQGPQPQPQQFPGVQAQGRYVFTPEVMAVLQAEMSSGDPQRIAAARQRFSQLQYQAAQPMRWQPQSVNGLPSSFNQFTGETVVGQLPPQAQSRIVTAAEVGIPAPPGTMVNLDPTGRATIITRPESGQQVVSAPGQPYQEGAVPGGSRDLTNPQNRFAGEQQLADDYRRDVSQYLDVRNSMQRIIAAAGEADRMTRLGQNQAPADIALITSYMRLLDPGVSVREGEYATAANAGSIPENIRAMYNRVVTGGTLTPEQRAGFVSSARSQYAPYEERFAGINQHYRQRAQSYGFEARNIIQDLPPLFPAQQQPQQQQPQGPANYPATPDFLRPGAQPQQRRFRTVRRAE